MLALKLIERKTVMETRETFVVTLFCDPQRSAEPGGRLLHVASNQKTTFKDLQELNHLLRTFAKTGEVQRDET